MRRTWVFALSVCFLFLCASGAGQSAPTEPQGMQALVAEVRQLRMDLHAANGNALKAQVLLYRLQLTQAAVARASERLNEARVRLADVQRHHTQLTATLKRLEESLENTELAPGDKKQVESENARMKAELETVATDEQQRQTAEMEAEEQMRTEQAKLNDLEERVDRLEKALDNPR